MNAVNQTTNPTGYIAAMVHEIESLNEKVTNLSTLSIKELEEIKAQIGLLNSLTDCYCQKIIQAETLSKVTQPRSQIQPIHTPPYPTAPYGHNPRSPQNIWNNPNEVFGYNMLRPPYPQQPMMQPHWLHPDYQAIGNTGFLNELAQHTEQGVDDLRGIPTMDDFPPNHTLHGLASHNQELLANHVHHGDGSGEDLATAPL